MAVCVLFLLLIVPYIGLGFVIVVFSRRTHLSLLLLFSLLLFILAVEQIIWLLVSLFVQEIYYECTCGEYCRKY